MQVRNFINIAAVVSMTASTTVMAFSAAPTAAQNLVATPSSQITVPTPAAKASEKTAAPVEITPFEAPFYDAEAAAATMKEDAADLEEAAGEELNEYDFEDLENDVNELIKTIAEGSKHFIEAWSYKNLMDIHIPVPSKVLTTASRGMDAVTKVIDLMSRTAVHLIGHRAHAPDVVVIPDYIVEPLKLGFKRPVQGINYIMDNTVLAVKQIRLKIRPTYFHKDPLVDPLKGAYGVITRAYNVLEAGQIFANVSINRTGLEWMPSLIEPVMNFAREIVVSLDGDVSQYPPLPPPPEKAPEFVWPDIPSIKDTLGQVKDIADKWETEENKLKELAGKLGLTKSHAHDAPVTSAAPQPTSQQTATSVLP
ncbi:hypothetical protein SEPCBS57363_004082 [Sporothrix epigloea]|uniref:Uncharacterized protein n=1 Tax=Sporothrix epigloea TaxID=1892477 RepID=A0ABP0DS74_9PEZI